MHHVVLTLLLFTYDPVAAEGSVASRYAEVVRELKMQLSAPGAKREALVAASGLAKKKFIELLDDSAPRSRLNVDDLLALAQAAERVKRFDDAIQYASRAAEVSSSIEADKSLVRSMCATGQLDSAADVFERARRQRPEDPQNYVLTNIIAAKCSARAEHGNAFQYYRLTLEQLLPNVDKDAFYARHVVKCLDWLEANAKESQQESEFREVLKTLRDQQRARCQSNQVPIERQVLRYVALIALDTRISTDQAAQDCNTWLSDLASHEKSDAASVRSWVSAVRQCAITCSTTLTFDNSASISTELVGKVRKQLLDQDLSADSREIEQVVAQLNDTLRAIESHKRLQRWANEVLFPSESPLLGVGSSSESDRLVYLFDPLDRRASAGNRELLKLTSLIRKNNLALVMAVPQTGLAWDPHDKRFYKRPDQPIEDERAALNQYAKTAGIRAAIVLLPRDSESGARLGSVSAPMLLRVDRNGRLVGGMAGNSSQAMGRVVR